MKKVVVASGNPVKIQATLNAFSRMFAPGRFEVDGAEVASGVGAQPMSDVETMKGAEQRALAAEEGVPEADFWVGIEGGVEENDGELLAFAWVVVRSAGFSSRGRSGAFVLPAPVSELVRAGRELGEANDIVFGRHNSKQEEGALGLLTGKVIDRRELYEHAILLALVPFKSSELYSSRRLDEGLPVVEVPLVATQGVLVFHDPQVQTLDPLLEQIELKGALIGHRLDLFGRHVDLAHIHSVGEELELTLHLGLLVLKVGAGGPGGRQLFLSPGGAAGAELNAGQDQPQALAFEGSLEQIGDFRQGLVELRQLGRDFGGHRWGRGFLPEQRSGTEHDCEAGRGGESAKIS